MQDKRLSAHDPASGHQCLLCGSGSLVEAAPAGWQQSGVTSDCKPSPPTVALMVCGNCGHVQKKIDGLYIAMLDDIYSRYEMYSMGGGEEQRVFVKGKPMARSAAVFNRLEEIDPLPVSGRMLDIGCGNGGALATFSETHPAWDLFGVERDARHGEKVLSLPRVKRLYTCALAEVPGAFDLITMFHVIEHLTAPASFMSTVIKKMNNGGRLLVQTADQAANPFDLLIADHCSHFTTSSLTGLLMAAGFEVSAVSTSWVGKEISAIGRNNGLSGAVRAHADSAQAINMVKKNTEWLDKTRKLAEKTAQERNFGILGTSIAASWLAGVVGDNLAFFADEDPARCGSAHMGIKVVPIGDAPPGSALFMAFPPPTADAIVRRLSGSFQHIDFIAPPPWP